MYLLRTLTIITAALTLVATARAQFTINVELGNIIEFPNPQLGWTGPNGSSDGYVAGTPVGQTAFSWQVPASSTQVVAFSTGVGYAEFPWSSIVGDATGGTLNFTVMEDFFTGQFHLSWTGTLTGGSSPGSTTGDNPIALSASSPISWSSPSPFLVPAIITAARLGEMALKLGSILAYVLGIFLGLFAAFFGIRFLLFAYSLSRASLRSQSQVMRDIYAHERSRRRLGLFSRRPRGNRPS